ncbi:hypothetical protein E2C01_044039 [Portunus trituberculatus]|uniref:Uncharacterized protein n=1 Tax=Portunus trituberculatus TaxID=210409 RepID=A0A5B7FXA8_PORTR|nr:hypothetical protein [Portunus trituberculatus]
MSPYVFLNTISWPEVALLIVKFLGSEPNVVSTRSIMDVVKSN